MIKFFRNIRKNFLNEGKTTNPASAMASAGTYLKYAIGEIVLVVIGILIALQINAWNEHRKNNKARIYYTHALIADLQKDSLQFSRINRQLGGLLATLDKIGKRISGPLATVDTLNKIIKQEWDPRLVAFHL